MTKSKLLRCGEGLIVTGAGILFAILSLRIRDNPVSIAGPLNAIVQAKLFPLILSVLIVLQGLWLTISLWKGTEETARNSAAPLRAWTVALLSAAYFISISLAGFAIPTVVYLGVLLSLVNRGRKPAQLLLLTALYSGITLLLIPAVLRLQLM